MANRFLVATLIGAVLALGVGCGGTDDESVLNPTPTQGPPTPTPLPICRGLEAPAGGLGCRAFTWQQPAASATAPTQLFTTLPTGNPSTFIPLTTLADNGVDPGPNFRELPPGFALLAGVPDPVTGQAEVTIGVLPENQLDPGFFILGIKPVLDYICLKLDLATVEGTLYCDGDERGVDTRITGPAGLISQDEMVITPLVDEERFGDPAPAGALLLRVVQQLGRIDQGSDPRYETCFTLPECEEGQVKDCYRPRQEVIFTTGTAFGMKGATPMLDSDLEEGVTGEPFECGVGWTMSDGPGRLVQGLIDYDTNAAPTFDVSTALRLAD